jgi:hypothetical protein
MSQHRYDAKDPKYRILYNHFNQPLFDVVMHGEESQVPGDLRQSEILIEQDFKI